jgi:hypothetical protein
MEKILKKPAQVAHHQPGTWHQFSLARELHLVSIFWLTAGPFLRQHHALQ